MKVTFSLSFRHALFPFPRRHLFLGKNPSDPCLGSISRNARTDASVARGQLPASVTKNPGATSPTMPQLVLRHRSSRFYCTHGRFSDRFGPRRSFIESSLVLHARPRRWVRVHHLVFHLRRGLVSHACLPPSPLFSVPRLPDRFHVRSGSFLRCVRSNLRCDMACWFGRRLCRHHGWIVWRLLSKTTGAHVRREGDVPADGKGTTRRVKRERTTVGKGEKIGPNRTGRNGADGERSRRKRRGSDPIHRDLFEASMVGPRTGASRRGRGGKERETSSARNGRSAWRVSIQSRERGQPEAWSRKTTSSCCWQPKKKAKRSSTRPDQVRVDARTGRDAKTEANGCTYRHVGLTRERRVEPAT